MAADKEDPQEGKPPRPDLPPSDVTERWEQWLEASGQLGTKGKSPKKDPKPVFWCFAQWWEARRLEREERARRRREEHVAAHSQTWLQAYEEWRLVRSERARIRREEKAAARLAALEARERAHAETAGRIAVTREALRRTLLFGTPSRVMEVLRSRRLAILAVLLSMVISGLAGALLMRARHRRYLTGTMVAVNGVVIRRDEFYDELVERYGQATLKQLVDREIRAQFIRAHGAEATKEQVEQRYRLEANSPEFHAVLADVGVTEWGYRGSLKRVLGEINLLCQGVEVTDDEVRAFYRRNVDPRNMRALFYTPPRVRLAVVASPSESRIRGALAALQAGQPFGAVAARYSIHDSAVHGGLLEPYYIGRSFTNMVTGLDSVARQLDEGEQAGPVRIGNVWWIVRCLERKPAVTRSYDDVKDTAKIFARLAKGIVKNKLRLDREFVEFQRKANIQTFATR